MGYDEFMDWLSIGSADDVTKFYRNVKESYENGDEHDIELYYKMTKGYMVNKGIDF